MVAFRRFSSYRGWPGQALLVLVLCAMLLRAAIPAGFMPVAKKDAPFFHALSLCLQGDGRALDGWLNDQNEPEHKTGLAHAACLYGHVLGISLLPTGAPPALPVVAPPLHTWTAAPAALSPLIFQSGPPLGPRGPPSLPT